MEPRLRIELRSLGYDASIIAIILARHGASVENRTRYSSVPQSRLHQKPRLVLEPLRGIEPRLTEYKTVVLPLDYSGLVAVPRNRTEFIGTYEAPEIRLPPACFDLVATVGFEPTCEGL